MNTNTEVDIMTRTIRKNFVRFLVQRKIFCDITGEVLDIDTCVVINDADGDPAMVMSPAGYARIVAVSIPEDKILGEGYTVDTTTVKG